MKTLWKEPLANHIITECLKLNLTDKIESMWGWNGNGDLYVEGEDLPGYMGSAITDKELQDVASPSAPFELWWCRAVANQQGLSIPFMDWAYYKYKVDQEVDENLLSTDK